MKKATPKTSLKLTEAIVRAGAGEGNFQHGLELYRGDAVFDTTMRGETLTGKCEGTNEPFYEVSVELDGGGVRKTSCECRYKLAGYCKHAVALLLSYVHKPGQFVARKELAELLAGLNREQMLALLVKLAEETPELRDWLEAEIALPVAAAKEKAKAPKRKKVDVQVYRRQTRSILHSLDHMRASEAYWHVGDLAGGLRGVQDKAMTFLDAGDAEPALEILLALLDESQDSFEDIDDSDGELGDFLNGVGEKLAEVILSLDLDEDRRKDLLSDLDEWDGNLSNYGVDGLDVAIAAAQYGWTDAPQELAAQSAGEDHDEADDWDDDDWDDDDDDDAPHYPATYSSPDPAVHLGRQLTRAKLNVLERQGHIEEFLALCLRMGGHLRYALKLCEMGRAPEAVKYALKNLTEADDALKLAQQLRETGHLDDAIRIGEHGLKLKGSKSLLGSWLGPIEEAQGRTSQALDAWMAALGDSPTLEKYQTVKRLAGSGWSKRKPEAMEAVQKSWNREEHVRVLLYEEQWDDVIKIAERDEYSYRVIGVAADGLIADRPDWVIRASVKQANGLIAKTQSKYYVHAANWLRRAKAAYAQLGKTDEWKKFLQNLKEEYKRRPALQAQLNKL